MYEDIKTLSAAYKNIDTTNKREKYTHLYVQKFSEICTFFLTT